MMGGLVFCLLSLSCGLACGLVYGLAIIKPVVTGLLFVTTEFVSLGGTGIGVGIRISVVLNVIGWKHRTHARQTPSSDSGTGEGPRKNKG